MGIKGYGQISSEIREHIEPLDSDCGWQSFREEKAKKGLQEHSLELFGSSIKVLCNHEDRGFYIYRVYLGDDLKLFDVTDLFEGTDLEGIIYGLIDDQIKGVHCEEPA